MVENLSLNASAGLIIADLGQIVPNLFDAWTSLRASWGFPSFYVGCSDDAHQWFQEQKQASEHVCVCVS